MTAWTGWLIALLAAYFLQFVVIFIFEHRRQANMTAWLFLSFVVPFIGFAAYYMIGRRRAQLVQASAANDQKERLAYAEERSFIVETSEWEESALARESRLQQALARLAPFPVTGRNRTRVLTNGEETYHTMLEAMKDAKHHIHLDYYTIRNDGVGRRFLDVLTKKARRGVEVRMIYDGIGSLALDEAYLNALREAGAECRCFAPPKAAFLERRINFRNHRKIALIDGKVGFVGGINIGDEYIGLDPKLGFWRDTHLRVEGDAVHYLQAMFLHDWQMVGGSGIPNPEAYMHEHSIDDKERVMIVPGRPGSNDRDIVEAFVTAMAAARKRIYATTPYFIPDPVIAASLRIAARSGIDVKLIIPGVSDSKLVLYATLSYVRDMLEAGVRVYRYRKGFIHAKVMIIDDIFASVGTANLDMRSLYSNYELLALLFDEKPIRRLERDFMEDLSVSEEIDLHAFTSRPGKQKAKEAVMHILSPML
ncbi:cardiolipin synthase [Paenibacillus nanensis]|uniref:Cardiolipin synthase n=1 Tax=Paenibacillus nanensis TaxID=393251 RepID=A0A3A1UZI0_9BACL|nr:cardiolipin synthase [Paenibacillus nanensis]RIX53086.1 cardiolipin synthase [Paenibacillus nanensis]